LTDLKDFVFACPLLPFGTIWDANAHCTHLQIAQTYPQTKICKRVQFHPNNLLIVKKFPQNIFIIQIFFCIKEMITFAVHFLY